MKSPNPGNKNFFRVIAALTGWFAIIVQLGINLSKTDSVSAELLRYFSFMTIWTNVVIALNYTVPLLFPKSKLANFFEKPVVQGALLIYILVVGLIYHFFLANQWNPQGWDKVTDVILHYIVPLLYLLFWILFSEKRKLKYINSIQWLIYPLIYVAYSLIKGAVTNLYPYPFIDVSKMGYTNALINTGYILLGYLILGIILVFIDKNLRVKLH